MKNKVCIYLITVFSEHGLAHLNIIDISYLKDVSVTQTTLNY